MRVLNCLISALIILIIVHLLTPIVYSQDKSQDEIFNELIKSLTNVHEDVWNKRKAVILLGEMKDPRAIEPLIGALGDHFIRSEVSDALVKIGSRAVEPLVAALKDHDLYVRNAAIAALGDIKDARAVEPLMALLKNGGSYDAAMALGKIGTPAVEPLISLLNDHKNEATHRFAAAKALGKTKDSRAVEPLIAALMDKDELVRTGAAEALGEIKDMRAVEPLIKALKDGNEKVRMRAADVLSEMDDPRAVKALKSQSDAAVVAGAYTFFIKKGEVGSEILLVNALNIYGYDKMAEDFYNSGNAHLSKAASEWAKKNGYMFLFSPRKPSLSWGKDK